jgi:ABC-type transporter Mla MlaB component
MSYRLAADASIRNVHEIWPELRAFIEAADAAMELDASALQRPDTALAQVLAMAVLRARERGKKLNVIGAPQSLRDLIRILGLGIVLDE